MKNRIGFVSNSSSSSFIITMKNGQKLDEQALSKAFAIPENSALKSIRDEILNLILSKATKEDDLDIISKKYAIDFNNDGDGLEQGLYYSDIEYEDEDIKIEGIR